MPDKIHFTAGHKNLYTYDVGGQKLRVINYSSNHILDIPMGTITPLSSTPSDYTVLTTDYLGNMIYENGSLKEILLPEGYYQNGVYYYYLKDHLGDNRVTINSSGTVVEKSHYYPSGTRFFTESTSNTLKPLPYRYNAKEMETMNGLNQMDYGARRRFSWGPIWTGTDPLAEKRPWESVYAYCGNNPMNRNDPTGMIWKDQSEADALTKEANDKVKELKNANQRLETRMQKAHDKGDSSKYADLMGKRDANKSAIGELQTSIGQIDAMGKDQVHTFAFQQISGDGAHYVTKDNDGTIVIQYSSTDLQLHETRHAYQYSTDKGGNFQWNDENQLAPVQNLNGMVNWAFSEQSAYRVQYAYSTSNMPRYVSSIYNINYQWVGGIGYPYNKFLPWMERYEIRQSLLQKLYRNDFINKQL